MNPRANYGMRGYPQTVIVSFGAHRLTLDWIGGHFGNSEMVPKPAASGSE
jgi:hypothetical protein